MTGMLDLKKILVLLDFNLVLKYPRCRKRSTSSTRAFSASQRMFAEAILFHTVVIKSTCSTFWQYLLTILVFRYLVGRRLVNYNHSGGGSSSTSSTSAVATNTWECVHKQKIITTVIGIASYRRRMILLLWYFYQFLYTFCLRWSFKFMMSQKTKNKYLKN